MILYQNSYRKCYRYCIIVFLVQYFVSLKRMHACLASSSSSSQNMFPDLYPSRPLVLGIKWYLVHTV